MDYQRRLTQAAIWLLGAIILALVAFAPTVWWQKHEENRPVVPIGPVPRLDEQGHDQGFNNPSKTTYQCIDAYFIIEPNAGALTSAPLEVDEIVFTANNFHTEGGTRWYQKDISNKTIPSQSPGAYRVKIVDRQNPGQRVTGTLKVTYGDRQHPREVHFGPMQVTIRRR